MKDVQVVPEKMYHVPFLHMKMTWEISRNGYLKQNISKESTKLNCNFNFHQKPGNEHYKNYTLTFSSN